MNLKKIVPNLKDDEEVIGLYHQFVLAYVWQWLGGGVLFLAPFFFLYVFLRWGIIGYIMLAILFLVGLLWLSRTYRVWYYSVLVMTSEKVVIVHQLGSFDRRVSQMTLDKINDVSYRQKGLWQTVFNYGTLMLQVSASPEKLVIDKMRQPATVQQAVYDAQAGYDQGGTREFSPAELLAVIREIRSRVGEDRWKQILTGDWELKQGLIDEVRAQDDDRARAVEQFFSRKI